MLKFYVHSTIGRFHCGILYKIQHLRTIKPIFALPKQRNIGTGDMTEPEPMASTAAFLVPVVVQEAPIYGHLTPFSLLGVVFV